MEYDEEQDDCALDEYRLNLHFLASDFKTFINRLYVFEDSESIAEIQAKVD